MTLEDIKHRIRDSGTLAERLAECRRRIVAACAERRGLRMSIPVQWDDDDIFIVTTLQDCSEGRTVTTEDDTPNQSLNVGKYGITPG